MSQKKAEKATIMEQSLALQQDLTSAGMKLEHVQREAPSKEQQHEVKHDRFMYALLTFVNFTSHCMFQNAMSELQSELWMLQSQSEECLNSHENRNKSPSEQVKELNQQREYTQHEVRFWSSSLFNIKIRLTFSVVS